MAKLEQHLFGRFDDILADLEHTVLSGSATASVEDGSDFRVDNVRTAVRVYERYSVFGGNRVSMNLTLTGNDAESFLTVITAGGSQALFFKVNTFGEESFLDTVRDAVARWAR